MVREDLFELFTQDNVDKQAKIEYSGGVMTNTELCQNSEELTEILCSGNELRFGSCNASYFKFKVYSIVKDMIGETISYSMIVDKKADSPLLIGRYKVASDKLTADRQSRQITAYDAMYDILNADMAAWYNSVLPAESSSMTLKQFRESFIRYFGLTEVVPKDGLVNDNMIVKRTIVPEQISGKDVITAICEINGCFGHIGRDGKFHFIYLQQAVGGLYPADDLYPDHAPDYLPNQQLTGHLYPQDPKAIKIGSGLRTAPPEYQSYVTRPITKLQIRKEENDIGRIWPDGEIQESDNCYIIQDNFLVYGKSHDELGTIAENIYSKITNIVYRPFSASCAGNPCLEVGDPVRMNTRYDIIESYILKRTLKGVQALRDRYVADGVEKYGEKVNGVHNSIIQLKGKANILTRTLEETKLEMYDIAEGLNNTITITAAQIRTEVADTKNNLQSQITQNAKEIDLRVTKDGVVSAINLSPETITIQAKKIDLKGLVNADELVSKFATITTLNATTANLQNVIATKATIDSLNAVSGRVGSLEADHVSVGSLNALSGRVGTLEADRITASEVAASYATITSLSAVDAKFNNLNASNIKSGTLSADRIDIQQLFAKSGSAVDLSVGSFFCHTSTTQLSNCGTVQTSSLSVGGTAASWKTATLPGGTTIKYLGS